MIKDFNEYLKKADVEQYDKFLYFVCKIIL